MPKIICCTQNEASVNIAKQLKLLDPKVEITEYEGSMLEPPTDFDTDYLVILSPHKMKQPLPMFTAHFPGNWAKADFGGEDSTLNTAYPSKLKQILSELTFNSKMSGLNWPVSLEADHHGPTCKVPMIYVELGSSEKEWNMPEPAKVIARSVLNSLAPAPKSKPVIAVGTGHYPKEFNKLLLETEYSVAHILPKFYLDKVEDGMIAQAVEKTIEKVVGLMIVRDSTNAKQRERISKLCSQQDLEYLEV